jgi:hypothetical protein
MRRSPGGWVQVGEQRVGQHANAAHRRDRLRRLRDRHHLEAGAGEAPGVQLDEEVTDLGVGEP